MCAHTPCSLPLPTEAMAGYGLSTLPDTSSQRPPPPGPPQENYANPPVTIQPPHAASAPNPGPKEPVQNIPVQPVINAGQPTFNTEKPAFNPVQPVYNAIQPGGQPVGQPVGQSVETYDGGQPVKATRAMAADQGVMQYPAPAPPPHLPPRTDIRPAAKPEPDVPSFTEGDAISDHGVYTHLGR